MLRRLRSALIAVVLALTMVVSTHGVVRASAASGPVPGGVPAVCPAPRPWPVATSQDAVVAQLARNTGIRLVGPYWRDPAYLPMVRVVWQTLEGLSCTDYVRRIETLHRGFTLNAAPISGWAWGDWGLTRSGAVTLDFGKWRQAIADHDQGRMVRLLVHELAHAWVTDRGSAGYWTVYERLDGRFGPISAYGSRATTENFSEIVGYYVARCAQHNPYDGGRFRGYYDYVRRTVFGGAEFGPAPGRTPDCSQPAGVRVVNRPVATEPSAPTRENGSSGVDIRHSSHRRAV